MSYTNRVYVKRNSKMYIGLWNCVSTIPLLGNEHFIILLIDARGLLLFCFEMNWEASNGMACDLHSMCIQ